jgi:enamidase
MFEKYRFGRSVNGEVENEKKQEGSMRTFLVAILLFAASSANAQQVAPAPKFIRENSPVIALTHVQLIDGTGAAAQADQTIVIDHGKISAVGSTASTNVPAGAKVIDARGKTVIPGLVGTLRACSWQ